MKVSNNALNFILAQYRAIFKRAYVKGLASAVLLTAGLAAGQAQAAALDNIDQVVSGTIVVGKTVGDVKATYNAINLKSKDGGQINGENKWNANVTVNSGALTTVNYIQVSGGAAVNITGTGALTINLDSTAGAANAGGVSFIGNGTSADADLTFDIKDINVVNGTMELKATTSGSVTVAADNITIGNTTANPSGTGIVKLSATTAANNAILGATDSVIAINKGGKVQLSGGAAGAAQVTGKSLDVLGGVLQFADGSGTIDVVDLNVDKDSYLLVTKGTNATTATFAGKTATVDGNVLVASGASLTINTVEANGNETDIEGQGIVTLGANSNTQIGGTLTVNKGTLVVDSKASLHSAHADGSIAIKDATPDDGTATTLQIHSSTLKAYLDGGQTVDTVEADASTGTGTSTTGKLTVSGGVIYFTDEGIVNLAEDFTFSGTASGISFSAASTIKADKLAVYSALTKNDTGTVTGDKDKIKLVADDLYLGSAEFDSATSADLGFSGATARNLYGADKNGTLKLGNKVTLDVTLGDKNINVDDLTSTSGVISGSFLVSGSTNTMTVEHGSYDLVGSIKVSGGGVLTVTNEDRGAAGNLDTVLTIGRGDSLTLAAGAASKITVDGDSAPEGVQTVLDIRNGTFTVQSGSTTSAVVEVKNSGTLWLTGDQFQDELLKTFGSNKGATVAVDKGTILVEGDVELSGDALTSGSASKEGVVYFSSANGGTLQVNGDLDISGITKTVKIGKGEVVAEGLSLTNSTSGTAVKLAEGQFTALKSLTSKDAAGISISGAQVSLGAIDGNDTDHYEALSTGGTIGTKLNVENGSSINVVAGRWSSSQDITITAGDLTIGLVDAEGNGHADAQNNPITASLSASKLVLDTAGSADVTSVGSLTVEKLTAKADGALNVQGDATIKGKIETTGTGTSAKTTYGIELAANSIDVGTGATVTIGEAATDAIKVSETQDSSTKKYLTIDSTAFAGKVFTVESAGEVHFAFGSGDVFTKDSIAEFRNALFNYDTQKGVIDGFINLGDAQIKGLAVDEKTGTVAWDTLKGYTDIIADVTTQDLADAKVTGITDGANVRGNLGSLETTADYAADVIQVDGNLTLNNAAANGGNFASTTTGAVLGLDVTAPADVVLNKGGNIGDITFSEADSSLTVNSAQGTTKIASINGSEATASFTTGTAVVAGTTDVAQLTTAAGTTTTFTDAVTVGENAGTNVASSIAGTTTFEADASFAQAATFAGNTTFKQDVNFDGVVTVNGGTTSVNTQDATATFAQNATILNGGLFQAQNVVLGSNANVFTVGSDTTAENQTGTGYLEVASFTLAGNDLVVDPAYGQRTSIAAIKGFADELSSETDAGVVDGRIFVGQNAALDVGTTASIAHMQEFIKNYQTNTGSLVQDEVGAVMYVSDKLTVKNDGRIILDSQNGQDRLLSNANKPGQYGVNGQDADMFLGKHTVLAIGDNILEDGSAIHFDKNGAGIMAEDGSATVVLDGDKFLNSNSITLFTDNDGGVMVMGDQDIRVETLNGVMYFMLEAGQETEAKRLQLDTYKIDSAYLGATDESRNLLLAYASRTANWEEYYSQDLTSSTTAGEGTAGESTSGAAGEGTQTPTPPTRVERAPLVAGLASPGEASIVNGEIVVTSAAQQAGLTADDFVIVYEDVEVPETEAGTEGASTRATVQQPVLYRVAHNEFLEAVARNTDGRALDSASLQGVFAGSAQAALLAARTSQDAVAGRTGVGASSSALTFADNGQGGGVWVAPIYVSQDSDGFAVENKDYGVDIDLYGVALGGDYTLANGIRVGAFFNVGSGDADGNGQASGVSNDFDYYGVGLYAGYNVGQFSVVGDLSYTSVDSDVEASTSVGKLSSSFDTDNFSVGVTGQYQFVFGATTVTPHAGLRYSALSIDDYRIETGYADGGNFDSDNLSVFSIPVGVTIAQEFTAGSWNVKPSFDLTLSGNFGDDEIDANTNWDGVANWSSNYTAEFIDNFTYGATLGVAAKTGAFSLGVGVSYTGSENTDEFGATANARFTF